MHIFLISIKNPSFWYIIRIWNSLLFIFWNSMRYPNKYSSKKFLHLYITPKIAHLGPIRPKIRSKVMIRIQGWIQAIFVAGYLPLLKLEIEAWNWSLKLKIEIVTWDCNLRLKLDIGSWNLKFLHFYGPFWYNFFFPLLGYFWVRGQVQKQFRNLVM